MKKSSVFLCLLLLAFILFFETSIIYAGEKVIGHLNTSKNEVVCQILADQSSTNYLVITRIENNYYICTEKNRFGPFLEIQDIKFFENGKSLLYKVKTDKGFSVYKNDQLILSTSMLISALYTVYELDKYLFYVTNEENILIKEIYTETGYFGKSFDNVQVMVDQKNKNIYMIINENDKAILLCNGKILKEAKKFYLQGFSSDGRLLYVEQLSDKKENVYIGDKLLGTFSYIKYLKIFDEKSYCICDSNKNQIFLHGYNFKYGPFKSVAQVYFDGNNVYHVSENKLYKANEFIRSFQKGVNVFLLKNIKDKEGKFQLYYLTMQDKYKYNYIINLYSTNKKDPLVTYWIKQKTLMSVGIGRCWCLTDNTFTFIGNIDANDTETIFLCSLNLSNPGSIFKIGSFKFDDEVSINHVFDNLVEFQVRDILYICLFDMTKVDQTFLVGSIVFNENGSPISYLFYQPEDSSIVLAFYNMLANS